MKRAAALSDNILIQDPISAEALWTVWQPDNSIRTYMGCKHSAPLEKSVHAGQPEILASVHSETHTAGLLNLDFGSWGCQPRCRGRAGVKVKQEQTSVFDQKSTVCLLSLSWIYLWPGFVPEALCPHKHADNGSFLGTSSRYTEKVSCQNRRVYKNTPPTHTHTPHTDTHTPLHLT